MDDETLVRLVLEMDRLYAESSEGEVHEQNTRYASQKAFLRRVWLMGAATAGKVSIP